MSEHIGIAMPAGCSVAEAQEALREPNATLKPGDIIHAIYSELFKFPTWCKVTPWTENIKGVATIGNGRTVVVWQDDSVMRLYIYNGEPAVPTLFGPPPLKPELWREYRREMLDAQAALNLAIAANCGGPEIVDEVARMVLARKCFAGTARKA